MQQIIIIRRISVPAPKSKPRDIAILRSVSVSSLGGRERMRNRKGR